MRTAQELKEVADACNKLTGLKLAEAATEECFKEASKGGYSLVYRINDARAKFIIEHLKAAGFGLKLHISEQGDDDDSELLWDISWESACSPPEFAAKDPESFPAVKEVMDKLRYENANPKKGVGRQFYIPAIKEVRTATGWDLQTGKAWVEAHQGPRAEAK